MPALAVCILLGGIAGTIINVRQWSLRQLVTPDALQGRVTASHRFLVNGACVSRQSPAQDARQRRDEIRRAG